MDVYEIWEFSCVSRFGSGEMDSEAAAVFKLPDVSITTIVSKAPSPDLFFANYIMFRYFPHGAHSKDAPLT